MKAPALLLIFLLALTTTSLSLAFAAEEEQVVDTNGKPIVPGRGYYVLPSVSGGGGLTLGRTGNSQCSLTVLQDYSEVNKGQPVRFSIKEEGFGPADGTISTGILLDVEFVHSPECVNGSTKWLIAIPDWPDLSKPYAAIGGAEDYPGGFLLLDLGAFYIQRYGTGYKLVYSIAVVKPDPKIGADVGREDDEHGRRLVVYGGNDPYQVVFEDAADHDSTGRSMAA